jgi:hypothetical protein
LLLCLALVLFQWAGGSSQQLEQTSPGRASFEQLTGQLDAVQIKLSEAQAALDQLRVQMLSTLERCHDCAPLHQSNDDAGAPPEAVSHKDDPDHHQDNDHEHEHQVEDHEHQDFSAHDEDDHDWGDSHRQDDDHHENDHHERDHHEDDDDHHEVEDHHQMRDHDHDRDDDDRQDDTQHHNDDHHHHNLKDEDQQKPASETPASIQSESVEPTQPEHEIEHEHEHEHEAEAEAEAEHEHEHEQPAQDHSEQASVVEQLRSPPSAVEPEAPSSPPAVGQDEEEVEKEEEIDDERGDGEGVPSGHEVKLEVARDPTEGDMKSSPVYGAGREPVALSSPAPDNSEGHESSTGAPEQVVTHADDQIEADEPADDAHDLGDGLSSRKATEHDGEHDDEQDNEQDGEREYDDKEHGDEHGSVHGSDHEGDHEHEHEDDHEDDHEDYQDEDHEDDHVVEHGEDEHGPEHEQKEQHAEPSPTETTSEHRADEPDHKSAEGRHEQEAEPSSGHAGLPPSASSDTKLDETDTTHDGHQEDGKLDSTGDEEHASEASEELEYERQTENVQMSVDSEYDKEKKAATNPFGIAANSNPFELAANWASDRKDEIASKVAPSIDGAKQGYKSMVTPSEQNSHDGAHRAQSAYERQLRDHVQGQVFGPDAHGHHEHELGQFEGRRQRAIDDDVHFGWDRHGALGGWQTKTQSLAADASELPNKAQAWASSQLPRPSTVDTSAQLDQQRLGPTVGGNYIHDMNGGSAGAGADGERSFTFSANQQQPHGQQRHESSMRRPPSLGSRGRNFYERYKGKLHRGGHDQNRHGVSHYKGSRVGAVLDRLRDNEFVNGLIEKTKTHALPKIKSAERHLGNTYSMLREGASNSARRYHRHQSKRRRLDDDDNRDHDRRDHYAATQHGQQYGPALHQPDLPRVVPDMIGRLPQVPPIVQQHQDHSGAWADYEAANTEQAGGSYRRRHRRSFKTRSSHSAITTATPPPYGS